MRSYFFAEKNLIVYEDGTVINSKTNKTLKHVPDKLGYPRIYYNAVNGKRAGIAVHRLLALAFIDNPFNKPCVNHIDGVKWNFSLDNLEWCTHRENTQHAHDTGLFLSYSNGFMDARNLVIRYMVATGTPTKKISDFFEITTMQISRICRGFTSGTSQREEDEAG